MLMEDLPIDSDADFMEAATAFLVAGRKYRDFLKRNRRDRLAGTVWVRTTDGGMVLFTEMERHANELVYRIHELESAHH